MLSPETTDTVGLGYGAKRWSGIASVLGDFSGEVKATKFTDFTNNTYYLDPNHATWSLVIAGSINMQALKTVDGVDISVFETEYDAHTHQTDTVTSETWNVHTGFDTSSWELSQGPVWDAIHLRKTDGTLVYISDSVISTSSGAGKTQLAVGQQAHIHHVKVIGASTGAPE